MTPPRTVQQTVSYEDDEQAIRELLESGTELSDSGAGSGDQADAGGNGSLDPSGQPIPPYSKRFETSRDLLELRKQFSAPRTPLLPSMDLYHQQKPGEDQATSRSSSPGSAPGKKSIVDTLPPLESVPPPAPFPAEAPPARPSVVPPVRQPRSDAPPPHYATPVRQSNPPPSPSGRFSSAPPPPSFSTEAVSSRFSSAPPPPSSGGSLGARANLAASLAKTEPLPLSHRGLSPEARRREAETIAAGANSPSYDGMQPIPSLRLPTFSPPGFGEPNIGEPTFGEPAIRTLENRRIGGVAFVLLVGLLIVAGAIMGIDYAAKSRSETATQVPVPATQAAEPRVRMERLAPNAVIAAGAATFPIQAGEPQQAPGSADSKGTTGENSDSARSAKSPRDLGNTLPAKTPPQAPTKAAPSALKRHPGTRSKDPNLVDTETPLISN